MWYINSPRALARKSMELLELICGPEPWLDDLTSVEKFTALIVLMTLCGITIFRKELSANHVYAEELQREKPPDEQDTNLRTFLLSVSSEQVIAGAKEFCCDQEESLQELYFRQQDGLKTLFSSMSTENIIAGATDFYHKQQERLFELYLRQHNRLHELYSWFLTCSANPPSVARLLELRCELEMNWKNVLGESKSPFSFLSNLIYVAYYGSDSKEDKDGDTTSGKPLLGLMPAEIAAFSIMSYLASEDLFTMAQVSRGFEKFANSDAVWKAAWWVRYKEVWESSATQNAALRWHCHSDSRNYPILPAGMTWKLFFSVFELSWLDWVLAGCNSENLCQIGIHGSIFDVTQFLDKHPGSPDTLMEKSGRNSTEIFEVVGHSNMARELMMNYLIVKRPEPIGTAVLNSVRSSLRQDSLLHENLIKRWLWTCATANSEDPRPHSLLTCNDCQEQINPVTALPREVCSHHKGDFIPVFNPVLGHWYAWVTCCGTFIHME